MASIEARGGFVRTIAVGILVTLGAGALFGACSKGGDTDPTARDRVTTTVDSNKLSDCGTSDFLVPEIDGQADPYTAQFVEAALEPQEAEPIKQEFRRSTSFETSSNILNEVFDQWSANVYVGKIPKGLQSTSKSDTSKFRHDPSNITQHTLDVSSRHMIEVLEDIPQPLMDSLKGKFNLYLSSTLMDGTAPAPATMIPSADGKRMDILLNVDKDVDTGSDLLWALTGLLTTELCGPNPDFKDFIAQNPDGFTYGSKPKDGMGTIDLFASGYSETNPRSDFEATLQSLIRFGLSPYCRLSDSAYTEGDTSPACKKTFSVLGTVATRSKVSAQQLAAA